MRKTSSAEPRTVIRIDGARGEGGGQILRSALTLSMVTGHPFRIDNVRAARRRPGLQRQHLAAVLASRAVCDATVEGAELGASSLTFVPGAVRSSDLDIDIATSGSTVLVAQTLIPALLGAPGSSRIVLRGGTHNPQSPPFEFLRDVYLAVLRRMGARVDARLARSGYFPAGGGCMTLTIEPAARLAPLVLMERGRLLAGTATAVVSKLPISIAERELRIVADELGWRALESREDTLSVGPGNVLMLRLDLEGLTELFTSYGRRGVPAERVARRAVAQVRAYLASRAAVGPHLADQLLLPIALAGAGRFSTLEPSGHALSNRDVIEQFLGPGIGFERDAAGGWTVTVRIAG